MFIKIESSTTLSPQEKCCRVDEYAVFKCSTEAENVDWDINGVPLMNVCEKDDYIIGRSTDFFFINVSCKVCHNNTKIGCTPFVNGANMTRQVAILRVQGNIILCK